MKNIQKISLVLMSASFIAASIVQAEPVSQNELEKMGLGGTVDVASVMSGKPRKVSEGRSTPTSPQPKKRTPAKTSPKKPAPTPQPKGNKKVPQSAKVQGCQVLNNTEGATVSVDCPNGARAALFGNAALTSRTTPDFDRRTSPGELITTDDGCMTFSYNLAHESVQSTLRNAKKKAKTKAQKRQLSGLLGKNLSQEYCVFPRRGKPRIELKTEERAIQVTLASGESIKLDAMDGHFIEGDLIRSIGSPGLGEVGSPRWDENSRLVREGVEIQSYSRGVVLYTGTNLSKQASPRSTRQGANDISVFIGPKGNECWVKNSEIFKKDKRKNTVLRMTDAQLADFLEQKAALGDPKVTGCEAIDVSFLRTPGPAKEPEKKPEPKKKPVPAKKPKKKAKKPAKKKAPKKVEDPTLGSFSDYESFSDQDTPVTVSPAEEY